jgi:hypothetical protein
MNRLTKIFVSFCFASMILILAYPTLAERDTKNKSNKIFVMEISVAGRPVFVLPVKADEQKIAVVPMPGTTASAVKIVPTAKGDSLRFDLLAVVEKLPEKLSCDNMKTLKTEQVTSYVAQEGKTIHVSEFGRFGMNSFVVKVRLVPDFELVCPDGACCCGVNTCYPDPGHCIGCGSCGQCCRTAQ